jgi:hypothetical protein
MLVRQGALIYNARIKNNTAKNAKQARQTFIDRCKSPIPDIGGVADIWFAPARITSSDSFHFPMAYKVNAGYVPPKGAVCEIEEPEQEKWSVATTMERGKDMDEGSLGMEPPPDTVRRIRFVTQSGAEIIERVIEQTSRITFKFPKNHDDILDYTGEVIDYKDPKNQFSPGSHIMALLSNARDIMKDGIHAPFTLFTPVELKPQDVYVDGVRKQGWTLSHGTSWIGYADPAMPSLSTTQPVLTPPMHDRILDEVDPRTKHKGVYIPTENESAQSKGYTDAPKRPPKGRKKLQVR